MNFFKKEGQKGKRKKGKRKISQNEKKGR